MTAATVTGAVAKREAGPVSIMWARRNHFRAVLPASVDVEAFLGTAAGALYASADLMKAAETSPDSLIVAMMRCAALGHLPGTDEFYLTPRKKKGVPQVLGIEGYRGVIERMYRSGAVAKVIVREVCAKDLFRYIEGEDEHPVHDFGGQGATGADFFGACGSRDRGEMVGVYAYAQLTTGAHSRPAILNRDDVHAAREAGGWRADDPFSPWNRLDAGKDHPEFQGRSMWWKTAAKRLEPWVPTSAEYRREQLRAAAAASDHAGRPGNGHAAPEMAPGPVYEAEIVDDPQPEPAPPQRRRGRAAPQNASPAAGHTPPAPAGEAQDDLPALIGQHFGRLGIPADDERLIYMGQLGGFTDDIPSSVSDLSRDQQHAVLEAVSRCKDVGQLQALTRRGDAPEVSDG